MPSGGTTKTYPALDLGAERGRAVLLHLNAGTIRTEVQRLATGGASSLQEVREIMDRSFPPEVFCPYGTDIGERQTERFQQYCECIHA
jgi:hypothetical protein